MDAAIKVSARVARKQPDLPRFVIVRTADIEQWRLEETTVLDLHINGVDRGRRTIKRWTRETWFLTITQADCEALGIDTGSMITIDLRRSSVELPAELEALIRSSVEAMARWEAFTTAQKRQLREEIAAAKQAATRERRARKALLGEHDRSEPDA